MYFDNEIYFSLYFIFLFSECYLVMIGIIWKKKSWINKMTRRYLTLVRSFCFLEIEGWRNFRLRIVKYKRLR